MQYHKAEWRVIVRGINWNGLGATTHPNNDVRETYITHDEALIEAARMSQDVFHRRIAPLREAMEQLIAPQLTEIFIYGEARQEVSIVFNQKPCIWRLIDNTWQDMPTYYKSVFEFYNLFRIKGQGKTFVKFNRIDIQDDDQRFIRPHDGVWFDVIKLTENSDPNSEPKQEVTRTIKLAMLPI